MGVAAAQNALAVLNGEQRARRHTGRGPTRCHTETSMKTLRLALAARRCSPQPARAGPGLAREAREDRRAVPAGRRGRRGHAQDGAKLQEQMGQTFVVENKAGADRHDRRGAGGASRRPTATRCSPTTRPIALLPHIFKKLPVRPREGPGAGRAHSCSRPMAVVVKADVAVQDARRPARRREGRAGQAHLRHRRRRHARRTSSPRRWASPQA